MPLNEYEKELIAFEDWTEEDLIEHYTGLYGEPPPMQLTRQELEDAIIDAETPMV